jgi:hypothetical protein
VAQTSQLAWPTFFQPHHAPHLAQLSLEAEGAQPRVWLHLMVAPHTEGRRRLAPLTGGPHLSTTPHSFPPHRQPSDASCHLTTSGPAVSHHPVAHAWPPQLCLMGPSIAGPRPTRIQTLNVIRASVATHCHRSRHRYPLSASIKGPRTPRSHHTSALSLSLSVS